MDINKSVMEAKVILNLTLNSCEFDGKSVDGIRIAVAAIFSRFLCRELAIRKIVVEDFKLLEKK